MYNVPYESYDQHDTVKIIVVHTPQLPTSTFATRHKNLQQARLLVWTLFALWLLTDSQGAIAAPQSCILCDKEDLKAKDPTSAAYEEYLFEHQVTRHDAINTLRALNESFYAGESPDNVCKSVTCNKKVMKYCLGPLFINDHCWCELGHNEEGLPFVPHICYVGEKIYTASVGSCFFYEEVKECCCAPALAKQWRHISASLPISERSILLFWTLIISSLFNIFKF